MDFELSDSERMVQKTARDFATAKIAPRAAELDRTEAFPTDLLQGLAELGLLGVNVRSEYGGAEAGVVAYAVAMMEVARACASTAVAMAVTNMVAEVIQAFGNDAQRDRHLPAITSGQHVTGAFALSEPAVGSDPGAMTTRAERSGDGWVLNGEKQWITNGAYAGVTVVWARTGGPGPKGISCFLVDKDTPGLGIGKPEDKLGLRGSNTVPLTFEDCRVPESALLGEEGMGFRIAMMALDGGRIGIGSQAVGIGTAALEAATEYAKDRHAFGKPIAAFQAIQWMLADSQTELEAARLLVLRAASLKQAKAPFTRQASMAKLFASEAAQRICNRAMQVHGGYGYTREFPVERYLRDVRVTTIYEGTSEIQRLVIARDLTQ
ncbi:MAG: acyl-CoA dehydrogenase family protein [Myxococcales bacterium]|nr:acyl-CoA dehydrogenase family protein [Myxococcales bacterium]MCB9576466.1 acyl-CoA dehydrogenase family protein [Polyangiaceae bacterium]